VIAKPATPGKLFLQEGGIAITGRMRVIGRNSLQWMYYNRRRRAILHAKLTLE
jgi:hypothetical protein